MRRIFISFLLIILTFSAAFAQDAAKLNFVAADKSNNAVGDFKKEEITLFIDGKSQTITSLEKQETPLIYALAVDSTGSMRLIFDDILGAGKYIVNQNRKDDETMLISFISYDKIRGMNSFSSDKNILMRVLDSFYIEGGQTALIDAIYASIQKVSEHKKGEGEKFRRVVIAITDGEERASYNTEKALLELIQKENVQVFFIGLVNELVAKSTKQKAKDFLERIAAASGGAAIFPKKMKDLPDTAAQLVSLLQSQYALSYTPDTKAKPQKIEIKLAKESKREDVKFYFRSGN
jgi:Ca-activated chloride channel homolog